MGSLTKGLKKVKLSDVEAERIRELAKQYVQDGLSPAEANKQAVVDILEETREEHTDVKKQVSKVIGD